MLDVDRSAEAASSGLHVIGGLFGAAEHIINGDMGGAIVVALTVAACIMILSGAAVLAEVARMKGRQFIRKHEPSALPEPRDKGSPDA